MDSASRPTRLPPVLLSPHKRRATALTGVSVRSATAPKLDPKPSHQHPAAAEASLNKGTDATILLSAEAGAGLGAEEGAVGVLNSRVRLASGKRRAATFPHQT